MKQKTCKSRGCRQQDWKLLYGQIRENASFFPVPFAPWAFKEQLAGELGGRQSWRRLLPRCDVRSKNTAQYEGIWPLCDCFDAPVWFQRRLARITREWAREPRQVGRHKMRGGQTNKALAWVEHEMKRSPALKRSGEGDEAFKGVTVEKLEYFGLRSVNTEGVDRGDAFELCRSSTREVTLRARRKCTARNFQLSFKKLGIKHQGDTHSARRVLASKDRRVARLKRKQSPVTTDRGRWLSCTIDNKALHERTF